MKLFYIAPAMGACALLMFSSCRSTDGDRYAETALPMSEVADGEIPPWLLDDDGSHGAQVSAGSHTPTAAGMARNQYAFPEPDESSSRASSRQNQPKLAEGHDDNFVETPTGLDPLSGRPVDEVSTSTNAVATVSTPSSSKPKSSSPKSKGKSSSSSRKPKQPTMVVYKVRPGDNLSVIAARSNTTVSQIMKDSNLKSTTIRPGQTIKVRYTPKGYKPSGKGGKGGKKGSASSSGKTHTITSGQTLSGIAAKYGVSTSKLMKANGLSAADAKKIRPGQKLKIPAKG